MKTHVPKIIWAALAMAQPLLLFAASRVAESGRGPVQNWQQTQQLFSGLAVILWIIAWFVIPRLLASGIRSKVASQPNTASVFPIMIVQWALFQSVTMLGFVIAMQAVDRKLMFPFLAASLFGLLLSYPSESRIKALIHMVTPTPRL